MADGNRALSKQIEKLSVRLETLETRIGGAAKTPGPKPTEGERFCALPPVPPRPLGADVSPFRERLIRYIEKKWVSGTKLHYYFFDSGPWVGPEAQKEMVRDGFEVWADLGIGIDFAEVTAIADSEIRIGFLEGDGSWSYVGRDVIDVPGKHERTMNFGWDITQDHRGVDVAVHEIGHTLGFPHEHQNPFSGIVWDEAAVYRVFGGPPNNWPRETVLHNILRKLPAATVEGSEWDPNSIMHYAFPAGVILEPEEYRGGLTPHLGLSEHDIAEVRRFYPKTSNTGMPKLEPFRSQMLSLKAAEQKDFVIEPTETRRHTIRTFGSSDTVMVLFESRDNDTRYIAGDDDSGTNLNAEINEWLTAGRRYVLRVRLYLNWASGDSSIMLW